MKERIRNASHIFLPAILLMLTAYFAFPPQIGRSQHEQIELQPGAIFTVTNNLDAGAGSFRQAIIDANASAGTDTIQFQIGTGPVNIHHSSALPDITQPVVIDGTTQPGFSGTPLIWLSSSSNGVFRIIGGGSTVKSIAIAGGFRDGGIVLENGGGNTIAGCFIGICPQDPTADCRNPVNGVQIINSPNNVIGGSTAAERNIIGGNGTNGIEITGSASTGNVVTGNYIGILADDTVKRNTDSGVAIINAPNNRIGGTTPGERNIISGNGLGSDLPQNQYRSAVLISGAGASGNVVQGNYIGTTIDGTAVIAGSSRLNGVRIDNAPNNTVGGTVGTTPGGACSGACNVISGILFRGGVSITGSGATGNSVLGNFIGTNAAGTVSLDNNVGVTITGAASNNVVGGTTASARNLITNGLVLTAGAATNIVQGNYIGPDTTGNVGIGQGTLFPNILVALGIDSAPNNQIGAEGGTTLGGGCTGGCNLISGNNASHGVFITGAGSTGNRVDYNYIGLNAAGTAALRNGGDAISLRSGASNNIIGRPLTATPFQKKEACVENSNLVIRCIKDDVTGDWVQFNDLTGEYTWENCRSGLGPISGQGEIDVNSVGIGLHSTTVHAFVNISTGIGSASIRTAGSSLDFKDSNVSDSTCVCPTEGMQTIVGTVTNAANDNKFSFISLGSSANGLVNLASPTADGNIFNQSGNFNVYSNLFVSTNGGNFPPIAVASGTDNSITGLKWSGAGPGSMVNFTTDLNDNQMRDPNDPLDVDVGANRTQNHPTISFVRRQRIADYIAVIVNAQFHSTPNTTFCLYFDIQTTRYSTFFPDLELTEIEGGQCRTVTTDANGNASVEFDMFESEAAAVFSGKSKIVARAGVVTQVPITAENPTGVVLGDTSEYSPPVAVPRPRFDFDEDGKTDIGVYRPGAAQNDLSYWYVLKSSDFTFRIQQFGNGEDKPVTGDYQGDGVTDFAVFRPSTGTWYNSRITGNPSTNFVGVRWGTSTDIPVVGDFDDDGANDAAIFRPSNGTWWIRRSLDGSFYVQQWGLATDKVVPADYDGDGDTDIAVYRNGTWYISPCAGCPPRYEQFGLAGDIPVPGDYDGDGRADVAVFRPSTGVWYAMRSTAGFFAVQWGLSTDMPLNGDFDADGKNDLAVWRPSEGVFYILRSEQGFMALQWGQNGDVPVPKFPGQ